MPTEKEKEILFKKRVERAKKAGKAIAAALRKAGYKKVRSREDILAVRRAVQWGVEAVLPGSHVDVQIEHWGY